MSIVAMRSFVPVLPMVLAIVVAQPSHCQGQAQEKAPSNPAAKPEKAEAEEPAKTPAADNNANPGQPDTNLPSPAPIPEESLFRYFAPFLSVATYPGAPIIIN